MELIRSWLERFAALLPASWWGWLAVGGTVVLAHYAYFVFLPHQAIMRLSTTRPALLRRYLRWVVATPSLLGSGLKLVPRLALTGTYLVEGRHEDAIAHGRANLEALTTGPRNPQLVALEAQIRATLADSLEALGRLDEAEDERRRAKICLAAAPVDGLQLITRAKALERANRHAEAYDLYEQALAAQADDPRLVRLETISHLILTAFNAGRPADCLRWAETSIAEGADGMLLRVAHRMAGIACSNLARLDESADHTRRALAVAEAQGDRKEMAEILGSLAEMDAKRGRLAEAFEASRRGEELHPGGRRIAWAVQAQVLRLWGRYDEALATYRRYAEGPKLAIPAMERRVQGAVALDAARAAAEGRDSATARSLIDQALAEFRNDAKLGLKAEAAHALVLAVEGAADESRRVAAGAERRLADFAHDPSTGRGVLYDLGMAALARGDHQAGVAAWTGYLALSPDPVHVPTALCQRGECRLALGDRTGARNDFRAAVAANIDSHHARVAARRLQEMGPV